MEWTRERSAGLLAALAAGAALGAALAAEQWGGLVPCLLCLLERWPYRIAVAFGLLAVVLPRRLSRAALAMLALVMLGGAGLGALHVGVEQGWWPSPLPGCAAPRFQGGSIADRLARMPERPAKPCDEPTFLLPGLPVSMAAMNGLAALAIAGGVIISLVGRQRRSGA